MLNFNINRHYVFMLGNTEKESLNNTHKFDLIENEVKQIIFLFNLLEKSKNKEGVKYVKKYLKIKE